MPSRIQGLAYGLGIGKQSDIATVGSTFMRMRKLNMDLHTPLYVTETDEDEIGKGNEFISEVFPVRYDMGASRIQKYGSAEFVTWALAYGLGNVSFGSGTYTIAPIDPSTTLELPYFSVVQQLGEGGGQAIDEVYIGNAVNSVELGFNYRPGRQSVTCNVEMVGSGRVTLPSGIALPSTPQAEHFMLSQSMALTINGIDYVSNKTILSGTVGWNNNVIDTGYFPGSGIVNSAAVKGRIEIGKRQPTFNFSARLLRTSSEYASLIAQSTGTAVLTLTYDVSNTVTITMEKMSFQAVERGEADGIVTVNVTGAPQFDAVNGVMSVSAKCGVTGIAQ